MYKIKQIPEDFEVKEIPSIKPLDSGDYTIAVLKKKGITTPDAIELVSKKLGINQRLIGYAGNKDRVAVTTQLISIKGNYKHLISKVKTRRFSLEFAGYAKKPLSLGDLEGNEFIISIRNIEEKDLEKIFEKIKARKSQIPNLFGKQRFSKNNGKIGEFIVKKQFNKACNLIIKNDSQFGPKLQEYLDISPNDYIGALRLIPKKILMIYTHSFQSFMFNESAVKISKLTKKNISIPIFGFGTELESTEIHRIIADIAKKENVAQRDFIIPQFPELSSEGNVRSLYIKPSNLKISQPENDELNENKKKLRLDFSLPKGSYATVVVEHLLS